MHIPPVLKSKDAAVITLLVAVGCLYYSLTYDYGFNTGDEGSLVLLTMRLLEGERPYLDLQLGYGLLWYYPLTLLFKITGVSFIVARIYLLSLAILGSLFAYLTIRRQTESKALAVSVALLYLVLPGDLQNIYIPFVVLANMLAMSSIDWDRKVLPGRRVFCAGIVVGVSVFIRAELALGAAVMLIAILAAHTVFSYPPRRSPRRLAGLFALASGGAMLPALPLVLIAYGQGFAKNLLVHITWPFRYLVQIPNLARTNNFAEASPEAATETGSTLARIPLAAVWEGGPAGILALLTYLPLFTLPLIGSIACLRMLRRHRQGHGVIGNDTAGVLVLLGLAITSFPQFFLFRPDPAHLSFFMPGYFVLVAVCLGRWVLPSLGTAATALPDPVLKRLGHLAFGSLLIVPIGLYLWLGVGTPTTGSMIAKVQGRTERFLGKNGVEVAVTPIERYLFDKVTRLVEAHTDEDDALLCFPFGPGWNVLTDRRTFAHELYVDDTMMTSPWQQQMLEGISREQPPVIIIDNWPINGTEISRFKNWATKIMDHIASEYVLLDSIGSLELYRRKEIDR